MVRAPGVRTMVLMMLFGIACPARAQAPDASPGVTDSAAAAFRAAVGRLTSPEFEQRKARRLELQRRGYASILQRAVARDTWGALLALLKMEAQLDYHLPTNTLVTTVYMQPPSPPSGGPAYLAPPAGMKYVQFPLIEDRRFPKNPWHK